MTYHKAKLMLVSYAQNHEDLNLLVFLHGVKKGFYVDVGANHAELHSVTKLFYDKGWSGINVEPIASLHAELAAARPRDINLNIGVGKKAGELKLREYPQHDGLSTMDPAIMKLHRGLPRKDYVVPVKPLRDIFAEHNVTHIDFLKVDVEGLEYDVLASNDWERWTPTIVVVEAASSSWHSLLAKYGYSEVFFDGLNRYFLHKSAEGPTIDDYPAVLLVNGYMGAREVRKVQEISDLQKRLKATAKLQKDWDLLHQRPEQFLGIKALTKALYGRIKVRLGR
ncbi:MAG: FkbM family methyltransferase [Candidatus Saccharibacteria bacterium]|nr:FkbM family methyltransferase [Candidatus Saccharibacteria bacterium]